MNEMWVGGVRGVARSLMDCVVRTWVRLANLSRFAAYSINNTHRSIYIYLRVYIRVRFRSGLLIQLPHPSRRGVAGSHPGRGTEGCRVALVTRLLQLILKINSFFGGCFTREQGVICPRSDDGSTQKPGPSFWLGVGVGATFGGGAVC